uniref:Synaptobrevin, longin-like domain protein n=1 Tax=Tanacetum cinerariifolium TaxID=118510 RepID=A0A6L2NQ75_TANCI|nr:hypothetical protein [Tanacetum cinerariifolium]
MVAYLTKSDASERFNQVINFLNGSYIKYALTVNPNIYVSCIKKFWNTVTIKQDNDVTRMQALVDKKKVVVIEAVIRDVLRLDDAEGVDCLPNEEIFAKLACMGYEKPSTKLTFYKAFFSSQWKFLIHTILQSMSAKRTSWNEFSSAMAYAVICLSTGRKFNFSKYIFDSLVRNIDNTSKFYMYPHFLQLIIRKQVGDRSTHTIKYASPALTQKVFANIKRVGKGFSGVKTPLFEGMLVGQEIEEGGDEEEHIKDVTAAQRDDVQEPSILSPTPPTQPPQPPQDLPSTSQVQHTPPQSPQAQPQPQPQPQPQQATDFPMSLLQEALDACVALTRRVDNLKYDKVAQALEITKLKKRVKKLEKGNRGRIIDEMDKDDAVALMDDKEEDKKDEEAKEDEPAEVQEVVDVVTTTKLITEVVTASSEIVTDTNTITFAAEPQVPAAMITAAPAKVAAAPSRRRKGVMDEEYARKLHAELNKDIDWDVAIDHVKLKAKEDPAVQRYQAMKRKPQTEAQARKNMMMYLKNVAGFKLDYFKGMSYDDIRPIFEAKFKSNIEFLLKTKEQMEEEESRVL